MHHLLSHKILEFVAAYRSEHGYSPSYREIQNGTEESGVSVSTIARHLVMLRQDGLLTFEDNLPRTVRVVKEVS